MDDLCHAQQSVIFNALGRAHEKHLRLEPLRHVLKRPAAMVRRHYAHDDLYARKGFLKIVGGSDRRRQREAGKKEVVRPGTGNTLQNIFFQRPETDFMVTTAARHHGQGRAPGASADDGNPAQICFSATGALAAPNLLSVPLSRRLMFWWCLRITIRETEDASSRDMASVLCRK